MPRKAGKSPREAQKAGPKSSAPARPQRAPAASKAPEGPAGKARRLARKVGEREARRMAATDAKAPQRSAATRQEGAEQPARAAAGALPPEPDAHEREAQQIGSRVASGQRVAPETISPIAGQAPAKCGNDMKAQKADAPAAGMKDTPCPPVQKAATATAPPADTASPAEVADRAIRAKGEGQPLDAGTRAVMESRMGVNLGSVRVHQDQRARQDAAALDARAFTYGDDIWLGPGESQGDIELMAHEATHVVQQGGGLRGGRIQRAGTPAPTDGAGTWDYEGPLGKIKKDERISIPVLQVPEWKAKFVKAPFTLKKKEEDAKRCTRQRAIWDAEAAAGSLAATLDAKLKDEKAPRMQKDGKPIFYLGLAGGGKDENYVVGTREAITKRALRPFWDRDGKAHNFHVDHQLEYQLTPEGGDADVITNLWLLDARANEASGQNIRTEKDGRIRSLLEAATIGKPKKGKKAADPAPETDPAKAKSVPIFTETPELKKVRARYAITFEKVKGGLAPAKIGADDTYTLDEIKDKATQVKKLKVLTPTQISEKRLAGSPDELVIYTREEGGRLKRVPKWPEGTKEKKVDFGYGGKAYRVTSVEYDKDTKSGMLRGDAYVDHVLMKKKPLPLPIHPMEAADYGGHVPFHEVNKAIKSALEVKGASPVEMGPVELTEDGFFGRGRVLPTIPLIRDIGIDLVLAGDDVYLSKTFTAEEFSFPGPIKVTTATLELYGGPKGLGGRGDVNFEIDRLGKGALHAAIDSKSGFAISGDFEFDSELFDPASIHVEYADDTFKGNGKIGITEGTVRGISSALLEVSFEGDKVDAKGTVTPSIPGIEQGSLEFHYAPDTGMVIAGRLDLRKDIPGLSGGYVSAELAKGVDGGWKVKAAGEANPNIPGLATTLKVMYDDGAFDASGSASFQRGMLKGGVSVGATNRPIGPDGVPAGEPGEKADQVTIYGSGSVALKLAPWLQAGATIRLLPNGEVEVVGEVRLPSALELFPGKRYDKNIFKIGIDIPIIGISVAGQRIGIFATIGGGLDLTAGIGPGMLQDLSLCVSYNPSHEDQTHIQGGAKLHIPADAGLRLYVKGGVGAGIPLVSAEAGLEVGGALGLQGAADAEVAVDWTPTQGLQIDAVGSIYVQPRFVFDISAYVLVELDLWLVTKTLYDRRWKLAAMEYGSGMKFGLKFPISYREGQAFDIAMSDVEFDLPAIDPASVLGDIIDKVVS